jgi:starch synthase (maltosyl-transferring)
LTKPIAQPNHDGRRRVIIEGVTPQIDGGRYAIKRVTGELVCVEADIFADGHDVLSARLKYRPAARPGWTEVEMQSPGNDRWRGQFTVGEPGVMHYTLEAWVDALKSWQLDLEKKIKAGLEVSTELQVGARLIRESAARAQGRDGQHLRAWADRLDTGGRGSMATRVGRALDSGLMELAGRYPDRRHSTHYAGELRVVVDPVRARFGAWYELFPRSCAPEPGRHGTFKDCEALLPEVAAMGFDVLYLPPIHPIGRSFRKGPNNQAKAGPDDPGSPWAIGSDAGGHKAIHAELGTLSDFRRLVGKAEVLGMRVALDIAFQCSPDHPYVRSHPEWFRHRPDGTIQYAENPPKKYQDIYPLDFETNDWRGLWRELKSVFEYWIQQGVTVFRVDNPHTKAFPFWEWCLGELKANHPELIFLSEAFTRPRLLENLAKLGFTQSYNYFPWRNTKGELTAYFTELTQGDSREYLRASLWPNTPDILTQYLQHGGRPAFMVRLILASTLGASYGIYGPAFELCVHQPREPGSEEYLDSEKYQLRTWNRKAPESVSELITRINRVRKENVALQSDASLRFLPVDNDQLLAYCKRDDASGNLVVVVVNLDPHHTHRGWITLPLEDFGLDSHQNYQMQDLLTSSHFLWRGARNFVELDPRFVPAHIFRLRRHVRSEQDFDYFL